MGYLQPLVTDQKPFDRIGIDTLDPFRRSRRDNEKIVSITDYATEWAIAKPIRRENAVYRHNTDG